MTGTAGSEGQLQGRGPSGEAAAPPHTGVQRIDEALEGLVGLSDTPLPEHHERLGRAHAALQEALAADPVDPERLRGQDQPPRS